MESLGLTLHEFLLFISGRQYELQFPARHPPIDTQVAEHFMSLSGHQTLIKE